MKCFFQSDSLKFPLEINPEDFVASLAVCHTFFYKFGRTYFSLPHLDFGFSVKLHSPACIYKSTSSPKVSSFAHRIFFDFYSALNPHYPVVYDPTWILSVFGELFFFHGIQISCQLALHYPRKKIFKTSFGRSTFILQRHRCSGMSIVL